MPEMWAMLFACYNLQKFVIITQFCRRYTVIGEMYADQDQCATFILRVVFPLRSLVRWVPRYRSSLCKSQQSIHRGETDCRLCGEPIGRFGNYRRVDTGG